MTQQEFIAKHLKLRAIPEYIVGVGGKQVQLMEATIEDLRAYRDWLDRRIARRERRRRRCR